MATTPPRDEWNILEQLLPDGWREQARTTGAFRRARYIQDPSVLLRVLLLHAVGDRGLRETVAQARAAGLVSMSQVALFLRLRTCVPWLAWIAAELCNRFRDEVSMPTGLRLRAIDSTTIQGPASTTTGWRLHYSLDLHRLSCDWSELTEGKVAEALERVPVERGDVLIADRAFLRPKGVQAVVRAGGHVLTRLRWCHPQMVGPNGKPIQALSRARPLRVGRIGDWPACLLVPGGDPIPGRIVAVRLPKAIAARARRRAQRRSARKQRRLHPRSLEAARFVLLFTTLPAETVDAVHVTQLYRYRWQIEIAFKRHKQILHMGRLPHKDPQAAQGWILAKLVMALLLENLYRNATAISPWGYRFRGEARTAA